ncbi:DNA-binding protein [Paraburkholderia adhaesiva]|uniref:DNA-binding protein n=1 Tax=Paraburkholderia adhaesiva TaxID=2883244 RepID=UPI001F37CCA1|nr:DNA-binding protein [Paraburkholderia adhaesiva]
MSDPLSDEARLAADIDRLKAEFPKTRELYREVCALMFFRFGITPTANRLYQLVHRGSMGTPTAVLAEFWSDLREKSRVRIEHADLPEDLQGAAGEFIGALWTRATTAAQASLVVLRDEVEQARRAAEASVAAREADLARTETALEQRTSALLAAQVRIHELEQAQASAESTRGSLEGEIARLEQEAREREAALAQTRADFTSQLERQRASTELAETRLQASEKRASLEIERERTANARLQREFESAAKRAARFEEGARAEIQSLQSQLGDLRHRAGVLEGHLDALRASHGGQTQEREPLPQKLPDTGAAAPRTGRAVKSSSGARKRAAKS